MRLFVALNLSYSCIQLCTAIQEYLRSLLIDKELSSIRFIFPDRLHITICPTMMIAQQDIESLINALKSVSFAPFGLCTSMLSLCSTTEILWLGIEESQELSQLVDAIQKVTHVFGSHEEKVNKKFIGHITLARSIKNNNDIQEALNRLNSRLPAQYFLITDFILKEAVLNAQGKLVSYADKYLFSAENKDF